MIRRVIVRLTTRYLGGLHRILYAASGGRIGSRIWGLEIVLLTTTGRRSGRQRTVPLCSLRNGDGFVVIASYGGLDRSPGWWLNLQQQPRATVRLGRNTHYVVGREATPSEHEHLWAQITTRAPGYLDYQRRTNRRIPVVLLEPLTQTSTASPSSTHSAASYADGARRASEPIVGERSAPHGRSPASEKIGSRRWRPQLHLLLNPLSEYPESKPRAPGPLGLTCER